MGRRVRMWHNSPRTLLSLRVNSSVLFFSFITSLIIFQSPSQFPLFFPTTPGTPPTKSLQKRSESSRSFPGDCKECLNVKPLPRPGVDWIPNRLLEREEDRKVGEDHRRWPVRVDVCCLVPSNQRPQVVCRSESPTSRPTYPLLT